MTIESQREQLLTALNAVEHLYHDSRQIGDLDTAQAEAMQMSNLCRRLELLRIQQKQEAK